MTKSNEPRVYLVGLTQPDLNVLYDFFRDELSKDFNLGEICKYADEHMIQYEGKDTEFIPTIAGKICYNSFHSGNVNMKDYLLEQIISKLHGSVLEHMSFNFIITNVSRKFSHEHVRHRIASISQRSQRYVNEENCDFYIPNEIASDKEMKELWDKTILDIRKTYKKFISKMKEKSNKDNTLTRKIINSAARTILPEATKTTLMWTINCRSLRNYLELRCSQNADREIRIVANKIFALAKQAFPAGFSDYTITNLSDETFEISTPYPRI